MPSDAPAKPALATATPAARAPATPSRVALLFATLCLFLVWSNTFLAFEVLLVPRSGAPRMGWLDLVVVRFVPVVVVCGVWCFGFRRREAVAIVRRHGARLLACGLLAVPLYNGLLYWGMAHGVSGPVASLLTTLSPLYLVLLGVVFLGERLGPRRVVGLVLGLAGVALVASAKGEAAGRPLDVVLLAVAPLAWSVYSALTKPVLSTVSPLTWTYLVLVAGGVPTCLLLPFHGGPQLAALDGTGWAIVLYLALGATVFGNAVWSWLLRRLPASTTGLTIFLNPPLTTASKRALSSLAPALFTFSVSPREWWGGALALLGVGVAVFTRPVRVARAGAVGA